MVAEPPSSDSAVDPLSSYYGLALFPDSFRVQPDPTKSWDFDADLDSIHNHLKSIALRSPNKLLEQAKMVLDGSSELLNSEIANFLASKAKIETGVALDEESLPERRPGLGRKRARFSLKPSLSQSAVSLESNLDIDQLKDPEEFFLAYERFENAKREIQKQTGRVSMNLEQHDPSTTVRPRRPGILGRSVRYKHRYSSVISENKENVISSQEPFESGIVIPIDDMPQHETDQNVVSRESELAGSMDKLEKNVNEILDELLSGNFEDLEGNGTISILQKRLQIKPIDLENLSLPELQGAQKINLNPSRGNITKPRKALSDIDNLLKKISSKTPEKLTKEAENSVNHIASPTPPRSPFAPFPSLQKHIVQSMPSNDPFSILDFDDSQGITPSLMESRKESDLYDSGKQLSNFDGLKSPLIEEDGTAVAKTGSPEAVIGDFTNSEAIVHDNSSKVSVDVDVGSSGTHVDMEDNVRGCNMDIDLDEQLSNCDKLKSPLIEEVDTTVAKTASPEAVIGDFTYAEAIVHDNPSKVSVGVDVGSSGTHVDVEDNVRSCNKDNDLDVQLSCHDADMTAQTNGPNNLEDKVEDMLQEPVEAVASPQPDLNMADATEEILNDIQSMLDQSSPAVVEEHAVHQLSKSPGDVPEQHLEECTEESLNEQNKATPPRPRKRKEKPCRKSLAGAGLLWEHGVRRSTRIRTRPLEYWKGERLLYGRIHQSLTTVIGLKYVSPSKEDGQPALKVKSFVSDEYKELVELAAL
ncbi:centromere protein C [Quercus robur]|uniref:centromere protein C n=1 Tax=Quercus robur TaxID=38942 RepID=UPI00216211BA|nr:centromere protein C [Quercus robur]